MYSKQKWEKQKYAYVIHTAVAQQAHDKVANITKTLIYQLKEKAEEHIVYIEKLLQESYRDISNSVVVLKHLNIRRLKRIFILLLYKG